MTQSDKKEEKNKETQKAEPTSEKEKKLNRKVADKLKFYGVVTVLSLLCAGFIWFIFKPDTPETVEGMAGINTTIPDAIAPETMADKQKAYELEEMKKRRQEKVRTLQDVAGGYLLQLLPGAPDCLIDQLENLAGHGRWLSDAGHNGRAEAGRRCTESGCYPEVQRKTAADFKADHLVLSGTEGESEGGRTGTAGEGA